MERDSEGQQLVAPLMGITPVLREFGCDPAAVLRAAGLPATALDEPSSTIPYVATGRLLAACVEATGCQHFGLLVGRRVTLDRFGPLGQLMRSAPTLGAAVIDYIGNQKRYARGAVAYSLAFGDTAVLGYAIYQPGVSAVAQIVDLAATVACNFVRELAGVTPEEILLARGAPADSEPYRRLLPAPVRFDADQTAIVLPLAMLNRAVPSADPARHAILAQSIARFWAVAEPDLRQQLLRLLRPRIVAESPCVEEAATALGLHPRTLNRRLNDAGTSYREVLAEARFETARQLLEGTQLDLQAIAMALGYAEPSVFTHAFRRWTGVSPSYWRAQADAPA